LFPVIPEMENGSVFILAPYNPFISNSFSINQSSCTQCYEIKMQTAIYSKLDYKFTNYVKAYIKKLFLEALQICYYK
jgi:hypothetical protein